MRDKIAIEDKRKYLIEATEMFCDEYLDEDYKQLCASLINKMARKRYVPFLSGRLEIWAAAVIHALGSINFLFDRNFEPYASAEDICDYFGTKRGTVSQKSKLIRDMFKMNYYDREFSTGYMMENNPFDKLFMVNGLIVDIESLPPEIRDAIRDENNRREK